MGRFKGFTDDYRRMNSRKRALFKQRQDSKPEKIWDLPLYLGVIVIIVTLIFMVFNLNKADSIVELWLPFVAAGVILVFLSQLGRWFA